MGIADQTGHVVVLPHVLRAVAVALGENLHLTPAMDAVRLVGITLEPADNWSINWNTLRYEEGCAATVANRFMIGSLAVKCNK